jgi:branched-chain amino acid transport system substrate-binding protein
LTVPQPSPPAQLDRRQLLKIFGAVAVAGAVGVTAACATPAVDAGNVEQPTGRTIKIGLVTPALGAYAKVGDDIQKGFQLFLSDNNKLLGLNTVDLKLVEEGPTPQSAAAAVKSLLNEGVLAIAGVANPDALPVLAPMMLAGGVPLICANTSPDTLVNPDYMWRVSSVEGEAGRSLARYAFSQGHRAYLFYEDSDAARDEVSAFRRAYTDMGGQIVGDTFGKVSFSKYLGQAKTAHADVLYGGYTGADAVLLLDAYRASGIDAKLLGPGSLTETADLSKLSPLPDGVYTSMFYAADLDNEKNRKFVASYHKAQGIQPSSYAAAAYDAAAVIDAALRTVGGTPSSATLNQGLGQLGQITSARGTWTFNENRTPQQRWYLRRLRLDGMVAANLVDTDLAVLS